MYKHAWWAWAIKNSICMICWAALAIYFGKWWIALFGLLALSSLETKRDGRGEDEGQSTQEADL